MDIFEFTKGSVFSVGTQGPELTSKRSARLASGSSASIYAHARGVGEGRDRNITYFWTPSVPSGRLSLKKMARCPDRWRNCPPKPNTRINIRQRKRYKCLIGPCRLEGVVELFSRLTTNF